MSKILGLRRKLNEKYCLGENHGIFAKAKESGAIIVEALISLSFFMFFVLAMYSSFITYEAHVKVGNTIIQVAQSLAVDEIYYEKAGGAGSSASAFSDLIGNILLNVTEGSDGFADTASFTLSGSGTNASNRVEERFKAYFGKGNKASGEEYAKQLKIVGGLGGIDLSSSTDSGSEIKVVAKYKILPLFNFPFFKFEPSEVTQSATAKSWK